MSDRSEFEAVRYTFRQDREGYILGLRVHPSDVDQGLMLDPSGQRYYVTLRRVDGEDQPIERAAKTEGQKLVQRAALMCKDPAFQAWMHKQGHAFDTDEGSVIEGLRILLGIESRADLLTDVRAQEMFKKVIEESRW